MKIEGGCLCGKVRYSADAEPAFVGVCHCKNCQKGTGTAFAVVVAVPKPALIVQGALQDLYGRGDSGKSNLPTLLPGMRLDTDRRGRGHAGRHDDHGRDARRPELGQAGHGDLLRQRPALGQPRRRQAALPENAGVGETA